MTIYFLLFTAALALLVQRLSMKKSLEGVEGDHRPDKLLVEPDEVFRLKVTLSNKTRRFIPFLRVRERLEQPLQSRTERGRLLDKGRGVTQVELTTWLRPRQQVICDIPVALTRRGRYVLQEFTLCAGDFLGLHEQEKRCGQFREVIAAPRELPSARLWEVFGGFMGEMSVTRFILEDPVLTLGFREYTGREPMKSISWPQSARMNQLMVRKNDYTQEPSAAVILNVETGREGREEVLETCFSLTRTVCTMLEKKGIRYSFVTNAFLSGGEAGLGNAADGLGERHYRGILEQLGRASYQTAMPLEGMLEREAARPTSAGRILITPGGEPLPQRSLHRLREAAGGRLLILNGSEAAQW